MTEKRMYIRPAIRRGIAHIFSKQEGDSIIGICGFRVNSAMVTEKLHKKTGLCEQCQKANF